VHAIAAGLGLGEPIPRQAGVDPEHHAALLDALAAMVAGNGRDAGPSPLSDEQVGEAAALLVSQAGHECGQGVSVWLRADFSATSSATSRRTRRKVASGNKF
jgi:hypothetical protein